MEIVHLPASRLAAHAERLAMRSRIARWSESAPALRLIDGRRRVVYCAGCATPVEFGAVWRGEETFCSVECSSGGDRPA